VVSVLKKLSMSTKLYLASAVIIITAVLTALIGRMAFDPLYSRIIIWISGLLVVAGKTLSTVKKGKRNKSMAKDIGIIIGIAAALVIYFQR